MANKPLKSIKFPGLSDTYTVPEVDATLATTGAAADAKKVGDEISDLKADLSEITSSPWTAEAISLLDQIGNYLPFSSSTGGQLWDDLIDELQNSTPATMYTVTWSGSNYTASNSATSVREGRGYECTVSPNDGYVISAMSVTMGETAITPTVSEGVYTISIASVTADITISVTTQADTSDIIYHVENLACDGTQSPIETPLQFSSASANGVTGNWTICASGSSNINTTGYLFCAGATKERLMLTSGQYRRLNNSIWDIQSMQNNRVAIVITHEAGSDTTLKSYYVSKASGTITNDSYTAVNAQARLSYASADTPLCIGADSAGGHPFIGTIEDVTIYNRILTAEEISAYITGGEA